MFEAAAIHVLILDGAGFHLPDGHADLPDNVRIVTLPPYSPELNPVEGLWDQLKDSLCNRVFTSLTEQRERIVSWLQTWWSDPRRVRSLIPDWLMVQANASSVTIIPVYQGGWYESHGTADSLNTAILRTCSKNP